MSPPTTPICTSSSNVFSWKISMLDWTKASVGESLYFQFETRVPPCGKRIKWNLIVYPKGLVHEETKFVGVGITMDDHEVDLDIHTEHDIGQFQIESAYRIRHAYPPGPLDMSKSRSYLSVHSKVFKTEPKFHWFVDSYEAGSVEDRAVGGILTLELEIRIYLAPFNKFKFSGIREEFVNNLATVDPKSGDVKLICEGEEIPCQKFLLISQSPVFKAMFGTDSKEKKENVVDIVDSTPKAVRLFVSFHYRGNLSYPEDLHLELIFGLLNLANKYQVQLLMDCCMDVLMDIMDVDNVLKIMAVVNTLDLGSIITDIVIEFMKKNIKVIVDKEDWASFLSDYPSLVKNFILNMNEEMVKAKDLPNRVANL